MNELWRRIQWMFRRRRLDAELEEELQFHLDMAAREHQENGLAPPEARRAASRQLGSRIRACEASREFWGWRWLDDLAADVRTGLRALGRRRTLTATAVSSLALGIGGAVAIFTVIHSVLLRPLPFREPAELVRVWVEEPGMPAGINTVSLPDYAAWRGQIPFLAEMAALLPRVEMNLTGDGPPEWVEGQKASADLFPLLGVAPLLGRTFAVGDEAHGAAPVVVLGHGLWQRRFGGDARVLGKPLAIDGIPHEVIGVMPPGFGLPDDRVAVWTPFDLSPAAVRDSEDHVQVLARLRRGISLDHARAMTAALAVEPLVRLSPAQLPRRGEIHLDHAVAIFAVGVSLLTGIVFGLIPALAGSKPELARWMQAAGRRTTGGPARQSMRKALVAAQIAVALTLAAGAGLMIQSFQRLLRVDVGFDPDRVLTFQVRLAEAGYASEIRRDGRATGFSLVSPRAPARYQQILEKLRAIPGVESASALPWLPMNGFFWEARRFTIVGRPRPAPGQPRPGAGYNPVDADIFRALRIPLVRGRLLNHQDTANSPWVVVINETLAKTWWPDQDPIGQPINFSDFGDSRPRQIVGIVKDLRQLARSQAPRPQIYFPFVQLPPENHTNRVRSRLHMSFLVRSTLATDQVAPRLREAVNSVDREVPVFAVQPMSHYLDESARETRFLTMLLGAFAGVALLLAAVGLFGVMSYAVAQRTSEIGIRVALGARPADMARMVLREASDVAGIGLIAGVAFALALTRFLRSVLFEIKPGDPATLAAASLLLGAVALAASYLPAHRASRVDPVVALRAE